MGSYAIRTRRLDPNALLRLRTFSEKWAPTDFMLGPFWEPFSQNCDCYVKKCVPKNASKKVPRQTQTRSYPQARRLPDSPPRVRGFLNKNQQSEQETTTVAHF